MRILVFSTDDHLYPAGGAEQAFGNIAERLPHIEFDLICAKLRKGVVGYERIGNVHIHRMGFGIPKIDGFIVALFGQFCAYKLMKKYSYDLIWSIMASYGGFAAVRVKRKTGLPFLLTLQEGDAFDYIYKKVRFVRKSFNEIFKRADGLQAISHYLLRWGKEMGYRGMYGRVVPNGVSLEHFTQTFTKEEIAAKRASFDFEKDATVLFTSSRLEKKNGLGDVIAALPSLPTNVCFVICGDGTLNQALREQVRQLHLESRVRFLGFVDPSELPLFMHAADIFIRPSLSEGLGSAFLEAMAARMLVVGTPVGGIPDFLKDGSTGFMVQPENSESVTRVIVTVLALDDSKKAEILDRAEKLVETSYNWNMISKQMETLFNELIEYGRSNTTGRIS